MNSRRVRSWWSVAVGFIALALLVAACGQPAATTVANPTAAVPTEAPKVTIKLAENSWAAASLNTYVAKILLEDELGYTVEVVSIDENAQWPALAAGDLHASLEIWPSGHAANVQQYIEEQKVVENLGPLGVIGKIGWYVPTYVVEEHPELATYEGFQNPEMAALFKTAETGDAGQFLAGDPAWVQYDQDIINNLGMNLQIVRAGSEEAVLAAVDSAFSRQEPVLFYFWTPHSVHAKYDLTEVKLPEYSEECYAKTESGGVDCDYPADELFKISWAGLQEAAPDAYQLLKNFNYTNEDQISMLAMVDIEGKSIEEAAQAWIDSNQAKWSAWLP